MTMRDAEARLDSEPGREHAGKMSPILQVWHGWGGVRAGYEVEMWFSRIWNPHAKVKWKQVQVNQDEAEDCALSICLQPAGRANFEKPEARGWWAIGMDQNKGLGEGGDASFSTMDTQEAKQNT